MFKTGWHARQHLGRTHDTARDEEWLPIAVGADDTVYLSARYENAIHRLRIVQREPLSVEGSVDQGVASVPDPASTAVALDASAAVPPIRSLTFGDPSSAPTHALLGAPHARAAPGLGLG